MHKLRPLVACSRNRNECEANLISAGHQRQSWTQARSAAQILTRRLCHVYGFVVADKGILEGPTKILTVSFHKKDGVKSACKSVLHE